MTVTLILRNQEYAVKSGMTNSRLASATYIIGADKVVLLLHDMDSGPEAWNDFVFGTNTLSASAKTSTSRVIAPAA